MIGEVESGSLIEDHPLVPAIPFPVVFSAFQMNQTRKTRDMSMRKVVLLELKSQVVREVMR